MNPPTIQTNDLSPDAAIQRNQSLATPASTSSIPRLPSQTFDSPSLDISFASFFASDTSEPAVAEKASKVQELSQENSELSERLRQVEQKLKAAQDETRKRNSMGATATLTR